MKPQLEELSDALIAKLNEGKLTVEPSLFDSLCIWNLPRPMSHIRIDEPFLYPFCLFAEATVSFQPSAGGGRVDLPKAGALYRAARAALKRQKLAEKENAMAAVLSLIPEAIAALNAL